MLKMFKHIAIFCNIFMSLNCAKIIPPANNTGTITTFPIGPGVEKNNNRTNKVLSEGGSITGNNPDTLPSKDLALINLEKNVSANKETSVVARKGVTYDEPYKTPEDGLASELPYPKVLDNTHKHFAIQMVTNNITLNNTNIPNSGQNINITKIHKPLRVSSELLAKMDKYNNISIDESGPGVRVHLVKPGSHPGMILPIVITILVVPLFAIVAYMVLKRGQEAWKNRHYKRMDFLLDGMYND